MEKESLIAEELERLEEKIEEFQLYLKQNTIITRVKNNKLKEVAEETNRHKEIDTQSKMINNLFIWLPLLQKLRETKPTEKKIVARGNGEINGLFEDAKK
jgi:uncharacterized protein YhaN